MAKILEYLNRDLLSKKELMFFCNLFVNQGLEQEIKKLKLYSSHPCTAQEDDAFDKFTTTAVHLVLKTCAESFLARNISTLPRWLT